VSLVSPKTLTEGKSIDDNQNAMWKKNSHVQYRGPPFEWIPITGRRWGGNSQKVFFWISATDEEGHCLLKTKSWNRKEKLTGAFGLGKKGAKGVNNDCCGGLGKQSLWGVGNKQLSGKRERGAGE